MIEIKYKIQRICSFASNSVLGYELLVDLTEKDQIQKMHVYKEILTRPKYTFDMMERLILGFESGAIQQSELVGKSIFINVEMEFLQFDDLKAMILRLHYYLVLKGIKLIVEITERIPKEGFNRSFINLKYLKSKSVVFAADDFEPLGDYREKMLQDGCFDIVKLEWSMTLNEHVKRIKSQCSNLSFIVEKIDNRKKLTNITDVWALQGFYCCNGISVQI